MTGREKIEAAFSSEGTREIAAVIPYEGIYIRDRWDELTGRPWWDAYDPDLERQLEWRSAVIDALGQDWFGLVLGASREDRDARVERQGDEVFLVNDAAGSRTRLRPPVTGGWNSLGRVESHHPERPAQTPRGIDAIVPPVDLVEPDEMDWGGRDDLTSRVMSLFGDRLCPTWSVSSPLWSCYGLWGYEAMMTYVATKPDLVHYACERYLCWSMRSVRAATALGASVVWIEECLTDQVSPEAYASINLPHLRVLVEEIRQRGLKSILYFCGDPAGKWEHILSAGADALALEEGKKGFSIDIREAARIVRGRCVLLGNLDSVHVLQNAGEETLRAQISRQIEAGRANGGRFIMSIGSPVTPGTPVSRVRLYCDLVHEMGRL